MSVSLIESEKYLKNDRALIPVYEAFASVIKSMVNNKIDKLRYPVFTSAMKSMLESSELSWLWDKDMTSNDDVLKKLDKLRELDCLRTQRQFTLFPFLEYYYIKNTRGSLSSSDLYELGSQIKQWIFEHKPCLKIIYNEIIDQLPKGNMSPCKPEHYEITLNAVIDSLNNTGVINFYGPGKMHYPHIIIEAFKYCNPIIKFKIERDYLLDDKQLASVLTALATNSSALKTLSLSSMQFSLKKNAINALVNLIFSCSQLQHIDLSNNLISGKNMAGILEFVWHSPVESLNVSYNVVPGAAIMHLFIMNKPQTLLTLNLENSIHDAKDTKRIMRVLQGNSTLQELNMNFCRFDDDSIQQFHYSVMQHKTLRNIYMSLSLMESSCILTKVAKTLSCNPPVMTIDLSRPLGIDESEGILAIFDSLRTNTVLRSLTLSSCRDLDIQSMKSMFDSLQTNTTLTSLSLKGFFGDPEREKLLINWMADNDSLRSLSLNDISDEAAQKIAEKLKSNSCLIALNFEFSSIKTPGFIALMNMMTTNKSIESLDLSTLCVGGDETPVKDENAECIANMLRSNNTLKSLILKCNNICEESSFKIIIKALQSNYSLTTLDLTWGGWEDCSVEIQHRINSILDRNRNLLKISPDIEPVVAFNGGVFFSHAGSSAQPSSFSSSITPLINQISLV